MSFEIRESLPLARFNFDPDWAPLRGAYIYPLRIFAPERSSDPNDYLEMVRVVDVDGTDVLVTRGGGLFVRDRGQYGAPKAIDNLASLFNMLLCEFALNGVIAQPVTDTDIQAAKLIGRHASITGGSGTYGERTWGPYGLLASGVRDVAKGYPPAEGRTSTVWPVNYFWTPCDPGVLSKIDGLPRALVLKQLSPTLPTLLVAAVYHSSRHNLSETILAAWIVSEQILSYLWDQHVSSVTDSGRRERLSDTRTYVASVRAEVLLTAGVLDQVTYDMVQKARKVRNDMAHRSEMDQAAAETCITSMHAMLRRLGLSIDSLPGYAYSSQGPSRPRRKLEPEFPFR